MFPKIWIYLLAVYHEKLNDARNNITINFFITRMYKLFF